MIKHLLFFRFKQEVVERERNLLIADLNEFPNHFPTMRNWALGKNISERDDTYSHAFSVEFENESQLNAYLNSHEHEVFVGTRFRPMIESRVIVTFEVN